MGTRKTAKVASNNAKKTRGKPFEPGNKTGRGRPEGSRNKATIMLEMLMADDGKAVVKKIIEVAKDGDMTAARLILDRIYPLPKGRPVWLRLPDTVTAENILAAHSVITAAMAKGTITPDEATTIAGLLEAKRKAIETVELEARVAILEERLMEAQ